MTELSRFGHVKTAEWAAGLFEGEGTVTVCRREPRLALKMTDLGTVEEFAAVLGVGKVYGPYRPLPPRRAYLYWVAAGRDGWIAWAQMSPWLSQRRWERFDETFGAAPNAQACRELVSIG